MMEIGMLTNLMMTTELGTMMELEVVALFEMLKEVVELIKLSMEVVSLKQLMELMVSRK